MGLPMTPNPRNPNVVFGILRSFAPEVVGDCRQYGW